MPIYEYRCKQCGEKFEAFRGINDKDDEVICPKCGVKKPHRTFASFFSFGSSESRGNLRFPT